MAGFSSPLSRPASIPTPPTSPSPPSSNTRSKRPLSPSLHITHPSSNGVMTPPASPTHPNLPPTAVFSTHPNYLQQHPDFTRHTIHPSDPRSADVYNQFKVFPWDVSCLSLLPHRRQIYSEVLSGKAMTTKKIEYLVELRFLGRQLRGWVEVAFGRSPHRLSPTDQEFIFCSIAAAYKEIPDAVNELASLKAGTYSSALKLYCDEVAAQFHELYENADARTVWGWGCKMAAARQHAEMRA